MQLLAWRATHARSSLQQEPGDQRCGWGYAGLSRGTDSSLAQQQAGYIFLEQQSAWKGDRRQRAW